MTRSASTPQLTAELRKLAHALDVAPERLDMLDGVPAEDLRTLRKQIGEAMFQADRHHLARVAALSKTIPVSLTVKLTEAVLPPLVAARTAELLEPHRAAQLVSRISEKYLADVSRYVDGSRAPEVVAAIPPERVADIAAELAGREEWVVIGSFVAHVTEEALAASVARFTGEQLLRIAFVLDDLSRMDDIGRMLTPGQIDELLTEAAELGLWVELEEFVENLAAPRRARLAEHYARLDATVRSAYEAAAEAGELDPADLARLTG
jgi:hypothetical protein